MKQEKGSETGLRIASGTGEEIRANVSDNTLKAYEHATRKLEDWLDGRTLNDTTLAEYIRFLHTEGKSPATINLLLSAIKWMAEYHGIEDVAGPITKRIWADIRGEDRPQGRSGGPMASRGVRWSGCAPLQNLQELWRAYVMRQ